MPIRLAVLSKSHDRSELKWISTTCVLILFLYFGMLVVSKNNNITLKTFFFRFFFLCALDLRSIAQSISDGIWRSLPLILTYKFTWTGGRGEKSEIKTGFQKGKVKKKAGGCEEWKKMVRVVNQQAINHELIFGRSLRGPTPLPTGQSQQLAVPTIEKIWIKQCGRGEKSSSYQTAFSPLAIKLSNLGLNAFEC